MLNALHSRWLPPTQAARLFGKLDFLNQTLFGKVGRVGLLPVKKRQYETTSEMTFELESALWWLLQIIIVCPPRQLRLDPDASGCVHLYTDGSSDPNRQPQHDIGALLVLPRPPYFLYTHAAVPDELVAKWLPRKNYIQLVELFAGPVAWDTFAPELTGVNVVHWVDNNSALGALVKGYSNVEDSVRLIGDYWIRVAKARAQCYIDRVESKSNPSDEPSRMKFDGLLTELRAKHVPANLSSYPDGGSSQSPTE